MCPCGRWTAVLAWLVVFSIQESEGVRISELRGPDVVEHNTNSTAVLDCVYELTERDISLLTVKWYLGDEQHPVYQWGIGLPPSDIGALKGRLHLGHVASADPLKKHRAISVMNPTVDLSGEYICKVTTNAQVDTKSKRMIVYVPARDMNFTHEKPTTSSINVSCLADGVFPSPRLQVFVQQEGKADSRRQLKDIFHQTTAVEDGLFDVVAHDVVEDSALEGTTTFECVLTLNNTEYSKRKLITYSSGDIALTPTVPPNETQIASTPFFSITRGQVAGAGGNKRASRVTEGATLAASIAGSADRMAQVSVGLVSAGLLVAVAGLSR